MALQDLIATHRFECVIAVKAEGEALHRMASVEKNIKARLGVDWLNHGQKKAVAFRMLTVALSVIRMEAFVFVHAGIKFDPTPKLMALDEATRHQLMNQGHPKHHEMVKQGLLTVHDVLSSVAQTPERVCTYIQAINPETWGKIGEPEVLMFSQSEFHGNVKVFRGGVPT